MYSTNITIGTLYLIPSTIGNSAIDKVIPFYVKEMINSIDEYIVENEKSARYFLKKSEIKIPLHNLKLYPLNEHISIEEISNYLSPILQGKNMGLISEAGCPAVADPGAEIVKMAHKKNIKVIPLVGSSSILLALMASGMNGQNFAFIGYIPRDKNEKLKKIKELEKESFIKKQTQIFIEAPYRNQHLLEDIVSTCANDTQLCIATDITLDSEFISTKSIHEWKKPLPLINKRPTIFLIYKS